MKEQGCIRWKGYINRRGYGVKCVGKKKQAHRWTWERCFGPIPAGMVVRHMCDNPACINHEHLQLGSLADNVYDAMKRDRLEYGERRCHAKLSEEKAVYAMARLLAGETRVSVARAFGVTPQAIARVWHGTAWRRVFRS